ncbi:unnamed protein product [Caenorhabditis auriculariae]|uniref:Uncharacterized protein n=1 Tax=Caenorhabditis auriculariae TaxID=2777116 RepID=A0A8S1H861_9PELO|nr:unnamed protein product [Caenorhabditis auriculariae]
MTGYNPEEEEDNQATVSSIRAKLMKKKNEVTFQEEEKDEDFERLIDEERKAREREELEKMASELKDMQKEYIKALRKPKEKKKVDDETPQSEAMASYTQLKMKFKSKAKNIVKQKDPKRESQTMDMLERFKKRLKSSNQEAILFDKKIKIEEEVKKEEGDEEEKKFGIDLDAEDVAGTDWMVHRFKAEDTDPALSKAKDANMRDVSEDWYEITDPRNLINRRRRGEV